MSKPFSWSYHVSRGGCWIYDPADAQVAYRYYSSLGYFYYDLGFRLVRIISALELIMEDCHE